MKFSDLLNIGPGDGDDPKKKKEHWAAQEMRVNAKKNLPYDNIPTMDLIRNASKQTGVNPAILWSSAAQEGMGKIFKAPDEVSKSYMKHYDKGEIGDDYPVDAFYNYGIDTLSEYLPKIQKYLPKDFQNQYKLYPASNEIDEKQWAKQVIPLLQQKGLLKPDFKPEFQGKEFYKTMNEVYGASEKYGGGLPEMKESLMTGAFKSNQDAMLVKAAILRNTMDEMEGYAKQKGYTLDDEAKNYFTLARYNASPETSMAMMDEYAAAKDKKAFLKQGVYRNKYGGGVHGNISPRLENMSVANELLNPPVVEPTVAPVLPQPEIVKQ